MMPNSSKYPPLPLVPKGSLKVMTTLAMWFLFQRGLNIMLPNLSRGHRTVALLTLQGLVCAACRHTHVRTCVVHSDYTRSHV